jgi:Cytochrome c7 and related cytochrome c
MKFLLRQISRSAEGREIVRPTEVEGARLTIGRDPESDVHLTDLAVALQHATVQRTAPMRLSVAAEEGLGVELNGRKVTSGVIELAAGGEIRIASHLLRILPAPADAEQVSVDVERVGESATDEHERADVNRFSLGSVMPSKRISAYVLMALVLGVFLAWPLWVYSQRGPVDQRGLLMADGRDKTIRPAGFQPDSMWSSGALSQVHHGLENQCNACHVRPFEPVQDSACKTCHTNIHDHGDTSGRFTAEQAMQRVVQARPPVTGFAGFRLAVAQAFNHMPGRCVDCHTEHEGPQQMPRTAQRFCSDCHGDLNSRLPDTRLGNAQDFGGTHPQFQPVVLTGWNGERATFQRIPLFRNPQENSGLKFPHALHLQPGGAATQMVRRLSQTGGRWGQHYNGESQLGCSDCHQATPDGARFQPVNMEEDCSGCHTLAFSQTEDGTFRTLRHGDPEQVIADLREFYRSHGPTRPAALSPLERRRPGDITQVRAAVVYARAQAGAAAAGSRAIAAVFQPGGACFDCHTIDQEGPLRFHVRPVAFPTRYLLHGWFDHRAHLTMQLPGAASVDGNGACLTCHGTDLGNGNFRMTSNQASNLMIPGLNSCQRCHGGEGSNSVVPSGCAMCHDYHMDQGVPAMILRRRVRGQRWETTVTPVAAMVAPR